jgi:hypothetical protein
VEARRGLTPDDERPSSIPPEAKNFVARARGAAVVVASVAGLVTAVGAFVRPRDDSATRASYEALAADVRALSEEQVKAHHDLDALRAYVDGMRGAPLTVSAAPRASASSRALAAPAASAAPSGSPPPPPASEPRPVDPLPFDAIVR